MSELRRAALYGRDHGVYGALHVEAVGERAAAAISAGATADAPSTAAKGDKANPNEDALVVLDDGRRVLVAVADSHFGHRASHTMIEHLARLTAVPVDLDGLAATLDRSARWPASVDDHSASTLCAAVFDRETGRGEGLNIGDSTVAVLDADGLRPANRHNSAYVHPGRHGKPSRMAAAFAFTAGPDALLLAYTDGVDECHYRRPETSVQAHHVRAVLTQTGPKPVAFARRLAELALAGVDGHPGGQDNIALIAVMA